MHGRPVNYSQPINRQHPYVAWMRGFWLPLPGRSLSILEDLSGRRNHGTMTGGASYSGGIDGFPAVYLDGSDDYVSVADNSALEFTAAEDWTFIVKFRRKTHDTNDGIISKKQSTSTTHPGYYLTLGDGSDIASWTWHDSDGSFRGVGSTTAFNDTARWYNVAVTFSLSETRGRFYLDGVQEGTDNIADIGDCSNAQPLLFGADPGGASPANIDISHVAIFNRLFTDSDLKAWNAFAKVGFPGLVNRLPRRTYAFVEAAPPATNRRRRILCGAA
jgi:hypothetical protein